jgi:hypothetical protein
MGGTWHTQHESLFANIFGIESYELKEIIMMAFKR